MRFLYGIECAEYEKVLKEYNKTFLVMKERYAKESLKIRGYLLLDEVLRNLGFPSYICARVPKTYGWVLGDDLSFGIEEIVLAFEENVFILDFNCREDVDYVLLKEKK